MKNKYEISKEGAAKIREYRKLVKDKYTDRRLRAVQLRGEGLKNKEICEKLDCDKRQLNRRVSQYVHGGIAALNPKRGGRRRENMSIEEEKLFLEQFEDEAGFGRINKPRYCWCKKGTRPDVPCHHIREYRYAYGAVESQKPEIVFFLYFQNATLTV